MGQSVSKVVSKPVAEAAQKVVKNQRPPPPSRVSSPQPPSSSSQQAPTPPPPLTHPTSSGKPTSAAANPGSFLRGEGLATQDIRDVGQEMFLQEIRKVDDISKGPPEMPQDLLKFIQDVGPAKKEVDKDLTSPRLLEKGNESELQKVESARQAVRARTRMPLMGEDETFTTTRNTNFSSRPEAADTKKYFGINNLQLFDFLSQKRDDKDVDSIVEEYHQKFASTNEDWTQKEIEQQKRLLKHTFHAIELPVLFKDPDGNFIGLYPEDAPGIEDKSLEPIPPTKVKLVLDDVLNDGDSTLRRAQENLEMSRKARKKH